MSDKTSDIVLVVLTAVIMLIIGANYHFLIGQYPEAGGTYASKIPTARTAYVAGNV